MKKTLIFIFSLIFLVNIAYADNVIRDTISLETDNTYQMDLGEYIVQGRIVDGKVQFTVTFPSGVPENSLYLESRDRYNYQTLHDGSMIYVNSFNDNEIDFSLYYKCGNEVCDSGESSDVCLEDCGCTSGVKCKDDEYKGVQKEDCSWEGLIKCQCGCKSYPEGLGYCDPCYPTPECGNGACDVVDDIDERDSCPQDCTGGYVDLVITNVEFIPEKPKPLSTVTAKITFENQGKEGNIGSPGWAYLKYRFQILQKDYNELVKPLGTDGTLKVLNPGEIYTVEKKFYTNKDPMSYDIVITVNPSGGAHEITRENNIFRKTIVVEEGSSSADPVNNNVNQNTDCVSGDSNCPSNCQYPTDSDCNECSTFVDCDDNDVSTTDSCSGSPKRCSNSEITECYPSDGYCPANCDSQTDTDCSVCSVNQDCDDNDLCTEDICSGSPKTCSNRVSVSGCSWEETDSCVPIGTRVERNYCDIDRSIKDQKDEDRLCSNNYECSSNVCIDNRCISQGFIQRLIYWFRGLFG